MTVRIRAAALIAGLALAVAAALPARAVEVQRVVSDGGIEAWLVEDHANPIVSIDLAFRGGASLDPEGKAGLANMVSGLLDEGAGKLDSQTFQEKLAEDAIKLSFNAGRDSFRGSLRTLKENTDKAIRLLALALREPRFDEKPVQRIRSQILAGLARNLQDPSTIAGRALDRVVYPDHPYGRPVDGGMESVKAITRADLRDFAATRFVRERLVVGVAGDITPAELKPLLDKAFGDLPASSGDLPSVPEVEAGGAGDIVVIEREVPQSRIAFAHEGIRRDDPDYYAASLVNYILGGGSFASRLYAEVREKRGLAYGVSSYLQPMDHGALVAGGLGTSNASVGKALSVVREEWRRMAEDGPTAAELADAKTYMTGSFPLRLSSTGNIAGMLVAMQLEELSIDYMDRRIELIEKVTPEQAKRVARELLNPEALAVVVVGKPEGVEATRPAPGESS
jgi:zinc protease